MDKTPLERMTELDEELEKQHPGWMTGAVEIERMEPDEDGWSEWIHPLPGYLMQCCDCNLIHEMETAIVKAHEAITPTADGEDSDHIIVFRMRRSNNTPHPAHSEKEQERHGLPNDPQA